MQTVVLTIAMVLVGIGLLVLAHRTGDLQDGAGGDSSAAFRKMAWLVFASAGFALTARLIRMGGLSLRWIGTGVGILLLGGIVSTTFDTSVSAFQKRAFGEHLFGLPVLWATVFAQIFLLGPALLLLGPSLFALASETLMLRGRGQGGMLTVLITGRGLPESLRRDRQRILFIGGYLVCLFIAWIVYTSYRGI